MKAKPSAESHLMSRAGSHVDSLAEWARRHRRIKATAKTILMPMRRLRRGAHYLRDLTRDNVRTVRRGTFEVSVDQCVTWLGFSFGSKGWHHYREAVKEIDSGFDPR